ncbi:MAG: Uma2 family endonuclease [Hyphomicrobium aestuarii]|nr:Uma2 family endonuclease [Hyphomicrobium aestuarii]
MNVQSKRSVFEPVDKAAFLRFIATEPEGRYEFEGGRIVQQMAGTLVHYRIAQRFLLSLLARIDAARWEVFTDWGVETAKTIRFGDVVVSPTSEANHQRWTTAPSVIVEVLSPSTVRTDLDIKPTEYLSLGSLQGYIVASQSEPVCLAWVRAADCRFPDQPVEFGAGDTITVDGLQLALAIDDIYRGVELIPADQFPSS